MQHRRLEGANAADTMMTWFHCSGPIAGASRVSEPSRGTTLVIRRQARRRAVYELLDTEKVTTNSGVPDGGLMRSTHGRQFIETAGICEW